MLKGATLRPAAAFAVPRATMMTRSHAAWPECMHAVQVPRVHSLRSALWRSRRGTSTRAEGWRWSWASRAANAHAEQALHGVGAATQGSVAARGNPNILGAALSTHPPRALHSGHVHVCDLCYDNVGMIIMKRAHLRHTP